MKTCIVFLFCLFSCCCLAQNYHPLIQTGVYRDEFWAPEWPLCQYDSGTRYWFRGDTVIGGQTYQTLLFNSIQGDPNAPLFCPPYTVDTTIGSFYALLREQVADQQVFQYDTVTNTEFLLFDFSAQVGDSLAIGNPPEIVYIESEAYETWPTGSERRTLVVNPPGGQARWQESVGSLSDLWHPLSPMCICQHGICYAQHGTGTSDDCATVVRTEEPVDGWTDILLSPNPASETIRLRTRSGQQFDHVAIFNLYGQLLVAHATPGNQSLDISIHSWPTGRYVALVWKDGLCLGRQVFQKY